MTGPRTTRPRPWLVGLACGLCLFAGCSSKTPPAQRGGGSTTSKAEKARADAEAVALAAVNGAAASQAHAFTEAAVRRDKGIHFNVAIAGIKPADGPTVSAAPPPAGGPSPAPPAPAASPPAAKAGPRPGPPPLIRERVVSAVATSEAAADEDALAQARDLVERKLAELDPPVRYKPSVGEVKAEFVRRDSRALRPPDPEQRELFAREGVTGNLVYVEYDVEITADQVRELRSQERSAAALRVLGMLVAVALAGFLFLRADEWTKGYLTSWLAIAAVVLAGGAAAAFIFV